jgi:hypothetical protein
VKCGAALVAAFHALLVGCAADHHGAGRSPDAAVADAGRRAHLDAAHGDGGAVATAERDGGHEANPTPVDAARRGQDAATRLDGSIPGACTDDASALPQSARCILRIQGRAVDAAGAPIATHTLASACGPSQCSPGSTAGDGTFAIDVGFHIDPDVYSVQLHVRPDQTAFYFALPKGATGPVVDMGALRVLPMPAHGPLLDVDRNGAPAQTVTSGDVTLDVPEGVYVRLDVESNLAGDHGREFRALTIARNFMEEFADDIVGVQAMYALEPFESSFDYPAPRSMAALVRLSFANTAALAAGTPVDVLALGSYVYPDWVKPAAFEKVASAHVSADGSRIELDPGEGLPHLTWIALRPS